MSATVQVTALPNGSAQSDLISFEEVMSVTGVSCACTYRQLRANRIPHLRIGIGIGIRIRCPTFTRWLEQNEA